jgi:hypothetical protein
MIASEMRSLLIAVCGLSIAACIWLAVMFVVLHRPGYEQGAAVSAVFVMQGLLGMAVACRWLSGTAWRFAAGAGALGIASAGTFAVARTIAGPHFEGYILIIGLLLIAQSILTIAQLITSLMTSSSKVHQFGN